MQGPGFELQPPPKKIVRLQIPFVLLILCKFLMTILIFSIYQKMTIVVSYIYQKRNKKILHSSLPP